MLSVTVALIPSRPSAVRAVTCVTNPVVTNNGDSGAGSLRQAIMDACDGDTITFDLTKFTSPITLTTADPTDATSGLVIGKNLTITGPGANLLTVERSGASGTPEFRIFTIASGFTVHISGLTVANGHAPDGDIAGNAGNGGNGGGINNSGTLTLNAVTVSGNSTGNGGIANGTLRSRGGRGGEGGGIFSAFATLTVTNSTISDNSTGNGGAGDGGNGAAGNGGGILSDGGAVTITNSTIAFNTTGGNGGTRGFGGGIFHNSATTIRPSIRASIIAGNSASSPDVSGSVTSAGFNLIGETDGSTGFTQPTDQTGTSSAPLDPKLQLDAMSKPLLNDNGGPTKTIALLPGSPAIDHGDDSVLTDTVGFPPSGLKTDQRGPGFPRKVCAHVDAGAYEFLSGVAPTVTCSDINVNNDPRKCSASVPFSVSATDACGNSLTLTCQIGNTMIMSPHTFPVGATVVNCSATDSSGLTGTCSFTVTVNDTNVPLVSCPANIAASSDPGKSTARVSFGASATDVCDGSLTPVYKIGTMVITSPYDFPPGVTTVTASATNSHGLTGMCSFTVTVTLLDICIQDNNSGDTFRLNSMTGQYVYTRCLDKFTLTGTGMLRTVNGIVSLTDSKPDRKISAVFLLGQMTGRANITQILGPGIYQTIVVNDTIPNASCACP